MKYHCPNCQSTNLLMWVSGQVRMVQREILGRIAIECWNIEDAWEKHHGLKCSRCGAIGNVRQFEEGKHEAAS